MQLFLISGLSGSGKSVALKALEDYGFYCIDNLPAELVSELVDFLLGKQYARVAISVDARSSSEGLARLPDLIGQLRQKQLTTHLLFLDAQDDVLVKRYSETRRAHPLAHVVDDKEVDATVSECVAYERILLADIGQLGHRIDTSQLSANMLRSWVRQFVERDQAQLTLVFQSFGFKYGVPLDADLVFDVRCLPNPFYDQALRPLTGLDKPVRDFLEAQPDVALMFEDIQQFLQRWLPRYIADNRSYLTVAVGCTGGQHRSVYLAQRLAERFNSYQLVLRHRHMQKT